MIESHSMLSTISFLIDCELFVKRLLCKTLMKLQQFNWSNRWLCLWHIHYTGFDAKTITINLLEHSIIYRYHFIFRLVEAPIDRFDPKICRQHLQECLKKVLKCYDSLYESAGVEKDARDAAVHRELIESLYLLLNLGSSEALARAICIPIEFK